MRQYEWAENGNIRPCPFIKYCRTYKIGCNGESYWCNNAEAMRKEGETMEQPKQPRFFISVWTWNGSEGYDPEIEFETDDEEQAKEHYNRMTPDIDNAQIELYERGEDGDELIEHKEF